MDTEIQKLLRAHLSRYPGMEPEDAILLLAQSELGDPAVLADEAAFLHALTAELCAPGLSAAPPPVDPLGEALCRVHLWDLSQGPAAETLARLCRATMLAHGGSAGALRQKLDALARLAKAGVLPWAADALTEKIRAFAEAGFPPLPHSPRFAALYRPHYRILARPLAAWLPVFTLADRALAQKPHVLVGIDGMSAAGKSGLADCLQQVYGCGLIHADDFFLRPHQRTPARLAQPGGNIDHERLAPVAAKAAANLPFQYQAYDCQLQQPGAWRTVPATPLTVLEGVYSLHPAVAAACDVRIFLSLDADLQMERVARRNTPALAERYRQEWIPMENRYFSEFSIRESCDLILDTTEF